MPSVVTLRVEPFLLTPASTAWACSQQAVSMCPHQVQEVTSPLYIYMSSSSDSNVATTPPVPPSAEPSSSGSRLKRKRSDVESSYASSASSASLFSRRTKQKIVERNDGENCWHCGSGATDVAHVISKKDGSVCFSLVRLTGLIASSVVTYRCG